YTSFPVLCSAEKERSRLSEQHFCYSPRRSHNHNVPHSPRFPPAPRKRTDPLPDGCCPGSRYTSHPPVYNWQEIPPEGHPVQRGYSSGIRRWVLFYLPLSCDCSCR